MIIDYSNTDLSKKLVERDAIIARYKGQKPTMKTTGPVWHGMNYDKGLHVILAPELDAYFNNDPEESGSRWVVTKNGNILNVWLDELQPISPKAGA
jgi:hypothetical protein